MGILSVKVTADMTFLPSVKGKQSKDGKDIGTAAEVKSEELTPFGIGAGLTIGYELPFGLLFAIQGSYAFTDVFKENSDFKKTTLGISDSKSATNLFNGGIAVGYNFANLLAE
jgi:hypothetical protein